MGKQTSRELAISLLLGGLIIGIAGALYFRHPANSSRVDKTAPSAASSVRGTLVPAFELKDLDGTVVRPQDFNGKVVLINFFGTTCGPCLTEMPLLVDIQKQYGPKGLAVLAISMYGEGPDVLKPFVAEHGMKGFNVAMGSPKVADLFGGVYGYPHTFIVDPQGRFVFTRAGIIDRTEVEAELTELLGDAKPATSSSS
jgi:thiol-disulfide isomerase/thioredoxin